MRRFIPYLIVILSMSFLGACAQKRPGWLDGRSEAYPETTYLTALGIDATRHGAADRARAELAKVFSVAISGRETSSEAAWLSRLGGDLSEQYRQTARSELVAVTDKLLQGVTISETWQDEETKEFYALAVLDRLRMARDLRVRVNDLDQEILEQVRLGDRAESSVRRLAHYMQALRALDRRQPLAADLRIADPAGFVASLPYTPAEVQGRAEEAAADIHLGIDLEGDRGGIVKGAMVRALAGIGMQLAPEWEQGLLINGAVTVEEYRTGEPWHWSVASAQLEFKEKEGATVDALRVSVREGSRIEERSRTLAMERLGQELAVQLVERIAGMGLAGR